MEFIKQHKGKALEKITEKARDPEPNYYSSMKRDGQMVQIAFDGTNIRMWTSNGHEFYNRSLAIDMMQDLPDVIPFHVECEYTGSTIGKLGDRRQCGRITTYRTEFAKGILSDGDPTENFWVFDILSFDGKDVRQDPFSARVGMLSQLSYGKMFRMEDQVAGVSIDQTKNELQGVLELGWEGTILTHKDHVVNDKGRSNLRIKFKETPTDYAMIVGVIPGTKQHLGVHGALLLQDSTGFQFSSGGGLDNEERRIPEEQLLGKTVKFGYESIKEGVYQQQRYLGAVLDYPDDKTLVRLTEL